VALKGVALLPEIMTKTGIEAPLMGPKGGGKAAGHLGDINQMLCKRLPAVGWRILKGMRIIRLQARFRVVNHRLGLSKCL